MAGTGKTILVVDDDPNIQELVVVLLMREGHKAVAAASGKEAMAKIRAGVPDAIITDMMMPDMGGYEFLRALQQGDAAEVPVIIITARRMDPMAEADLKRERNVFAHFPKPVDHQKLLAAVKSALEGGPGPAS